jgi:putative FmdB family regulatory protein
MPVFEYKCPSCNMKFEVLHKSSINQDEVSCPDCDSKKITKLFSTFSPSVYSHSHESSCSQGNCNMPAGSCCGDGECALN